MTTTDRHKTKPLSLRLPEALSAWVNAQSAATGKPVRRIILDAIEQAKERDEAPCASLTEHCIKDLDALPAEQDEFGHTPECRSHVNRSSDQCSCGGRIQLTGDSGVIIAELWRDGECIARWTDKDGPPGLAGMLPRLRELGWTIHDSR